MRHRLLLGLVLACLTIALSAIPASADRFAGWYRNCPTILVSENGRLQVATCGRGHPSWVVRCDGRDWLSASPQLFRDSSSRSFVWCRRHVHAL